MNPGELITVDRKEFEALLARLNHLESEKRINFWQWFLQRPAMVLAVFVMVSVLAAGAQEISGLYNGNIYLAQPSIFRDGYVAGVVDTCHSNIDQSALLKFNECTINMTLEQIRAIVEKYLQNNPQTRHAQMAVLATQAVIESCPLPSETGQGEPSFTIERRRRR